MTERIPSSRYIVQVFVGALSPCYEALSVEASKQTTAEEIVSCIIERLGLPSSSGFELAEVVGDGLGRECKERRLGPAESPIAVMLLWPQIIDSEQEFYRFYLREKLSDNLWADGFTMDPQLIRDYFYRFLYQPQDREYPDLCQLPDLNEQTLLDNLRARFTAGHIYTYVGSILIAVNPFKFHPIYNPKYVKLYQNRRLGPELPPHIFAIADSAYHCMLKERRNQCIVISGESGSGKTESTNFLLHHLTALSQKGSHGSGVEQTILSAGPVLEAFGNAKTAHNNNSSRFGKFIQVNYKENGMVHGAVVQKYLLEKSRICSQGSNERNYHVFYYLLAGASDAERDSLHLQNIESYNYLNRTGCYLLDNIDEKYEFSRLKQSMEMVGFTQEKQKRLFAVLSSVLLLGNIEFQPRKLAYHHDEAVAVKNPEIVGIISELLHVKQETLLGALTAKRARASGETLVISYKFHEALAARDAIAKCLYGALFDWIVLQVNHALLSKKDTLKAHQGNSIGVLDIFGFEDFGLSNSFEQFCINYANEHLQYYFNQHVFKYEQEEYRKEGLTWKDIGFLDNTGCLQLIEGKPNGLLCVLDDHCNFPGATSETLLQKFNTVHKDNLFYEMPQRRENAFIVRHYAGKVKYQVSEMREKNLDLMRQDIVSVLKNSRMAFVRELVGADPVAVFRWAILRAFFRAYFAFNEAGRRHRQCRDGNKTSVTQNRYRNSVQNEDLIKCYPRWRRQSDDTAISGKGTTTDGKNRRSCSIGNNNAAGSSRHACLRKTCDVNEAVNTAVTSGGGGGGFRGRALYPGEAEVFQRATQIVMKNKSFRPRDRGKKGLKNLQSVKTLAGRTQSYTNTLSVKARKQPLTVSAQFQLSLHSLMETLNQANPFFIRCIKSNSDKISNLFDEETVQRQLRYTGMLETVRIRQAGYNVRLSYEEFIHIYRILLPKGLSSTPEDVRDFLLSLNLNNDNYQLGGSKIFLRECEKLKLDYHLHQQIMASIVTLQRWFRVIIERRRFLRLREAVMTIQSCWRRVQGQRLHNNAATRIQSVWRAHRTTAWYRKLKNGVIYFQAHARGYLARNRAREMIAAKASTASASTAAAADRVYCMEDSLHSDSDHADSESELPERINAMSFSRIEKREIKKQYRVKRPVLEDFTIEEKQDRRGSLAKSDRRSSLEKYERKCSLESKLSGGSSGSGGGGGYERKFSLEKYEGTSSSRAITAGDNRFHHQQRRICSLDKCEGGRKASVSSQRKSSGDSLCSIKSVDSHSSSIFTNDSSSHDATTATTTTTTTTTTKKQKHLVEASREKSREGRSDSDDDVEKTSLRSAEFFQMPRRPLPSRSAHVTQSSSEPTAPARHSRRRDGGGGSGGGGGFNYNVNVDSNVNVDGNAIIADEGGGGKQGRSGKLVPYLLGQQSNSYNSIDDSSLNDAPPTLSIQRRNSDPATQILGADIQDVKTNPEPLYEKNPIGHSPSLDLEWKGPYMFAIAGHRFCKIRRFSKEDRCMYCTKPMDAFVTQGHKCQDCKNLFHTKCIQNGGVLKIPCSQQTPSRKRRKVQGIPDKEQKDKDWNLTRTSEFTDRTDKIISDARELQLMQDFINKKIYIIQSEEGGTKPSQVDKIFQQALREFKDNLVSTYSVANKQGAEILNIKYKDLIANFINVIETVCQLQGSTGKDFPVTLYVNAFRGFMNEFMSLNRIEQTEKPGGKAKRKKGKKQKTNDFVSHAGHVFQLNMINIPTACEVCSSFFLWPLERSLVCKNCKLTCHKKCYPKVAAECGKDASNVENSGHAGNKGVFGVPLHTLGTGSGKVPLIMERLITTVEMYGLYTEGIYRKSGLTSKVRELKNLIEQSDIENVRFEEYQVHVLSSVLKSFLREMPEPLLTFECYDDFIRAASLTEDRVSTLFAILKKLPKRNYDLMERLVFHLARVALHEDVNRMNAASLAIIFAPCILRTNKIVPAQNSLNDIEHQTLCIKLIITEQMDKVKAALADIDTLDSASHSASHRLSYLRISKVNSPMEVDDIGNKLEDEEEMLLVDKIQEIEKEKAILTCQLPSLRRTTSDDDLLSTDDGSLDDMDTNPHTHVDHSTTTTTGSHHKRQIHRTSNKKGESHVPDSDDEDPIMV